MPSDLVTETAFGAAEDVGPLEAKHLDSRLYRNAADSTRVTATHWHIAWANGCLLYTSGAADDLWPGDAAVGALVDQIRARCLEFNAWWAEHGVGASISVFSLVRAIRDRGVDRCPFNVGPRLGRDRACTRRPDTGQKGGYHVLVLSLIHIL